MLKVSTGILVTNMQDLPEHIPLLQSTGIGTLLTEMQATTEKDMRRIGKDMREKGTGTMRADRDIVHHIGADTVEVLQDTVHHIDIIIAEVHRDTVHLIDGIIVEAHQDTVHHTDGIIAEVRQDTVLHTEDIIVEVHQDTVLENETWNGITKRRHIMRDGNMNEGDMNMKDGIVLLTSGITGVIVEPTTLRGTGAITGLPVSIATGPLAGILVIPVTQKRYHCPSILGEVHRFANLLQTERKSWKNTGTF